MTGPSQLYPRHKGQQLNYYTYCPFTLIALLHYYTITLLQLLHYYTYYTITLLHLLPY